MGLDMWIYGIKDILNDGIPDNMPESWYEENEYNIIRIDEEDNEFDDMFKDLYNYSVIRNVIYTEIDWNKLMKDYEIDKNARLSGWSSDGRIGFSCKNYYKEITVTQHELKKYNIDVTAKILVYKADELAYWRKEYDLQNLIYNEYCGQIYNCGFHEIDNEMMRKINRYLRVRDMSKQSINDDGYVAKMYHEWY